MVALVSLAKGSWRLDGIVAADYTEFLPIGFDPDAEPIDSSDLENPGYDGQYSGVDFYRGPVWRLEVAVVGATEAEAYASLRRLKAAWRAEKYAKRAGSEAALYHNWAGVEMVAFGRPRRFQSSDMAVTSKHCYYMVALEFQLVDPILYEGAQRSVRLTIVPPVIRGLREVDLEEPLSTGGGGTRLGAIDAVGGTAPTPFSVQIVAPNGMRNPGFRLGDSSYQFPGLELSNGQSLVVDSRAGTARVGSRSVLSLMARRARLKSVRLPVGRVDLAFSGVDYSQTAYADYRWRPAHYI